MHLYIFSNAFPYIWIQCIQSVIYSDNLRTHSKILVWFLEKSIHKHSFLSKSMALLTFIAFTFRRVKWKSLSHLRLPNPGIGPRSPALQVDSLPVELQGKPKNNGVGSLSFFQWIFPTQEANRDLLHCRQILYQLSYQGSPRILEWVA